MHLFNVSNYKCQTKEHVRNVAFSSLNRKGQSHCERSLSLPEVVQEVISVLYLDDQRVKLLNGSSKYRCVAFFFSSGCGLECKFIRPAWNEMEKRFCISAQSKWMLFREASCFFLVMCGDFLSFISFEIDFLITVYARLLAFFFRFHVRKLKN